MRRLTAYRLRILSYRSDSSFQATSTDTLPACSLLCANTTSNVAEHLCWNKLQVLIHLTADVSIIIFSGDRRSVIIIITILLCHSLPHSTSFPRTVQTGDILLRLDPSNLWLWLKHVACRLIFVRVEYGTWFACQVTICLSWILLWQWTHLAPHFGLSHTLGQTAACNHRVASKLSPRAKTSCKYRSIQVCRLFRFSRLPITTTTATTFHANKRSPNTRVRFSNPSLGQAPKALAELLRQA